MADHYGAGISLPRELSHTSDDSSPDHSPRCIPARAALSIPPPPPPSTLPLVDIQRKPRGRPPGSKNKPKAPIIITKDADSSFMRPAVLVIAPGSNIIDSIVGFARRNHLALSVISAYGAVSTVTLRHPGGNAPSLTLPGPFNLLLLCGSYLGSFLSSNPAFGVSLAGVQGQVFGGIVAGKLTAVTQVVVVVATFGSPSFHRLPKENIDETHDNLFAGGGGGGRGGDEVCATSGMSMNVYGVGNPSPISSCQVPSPDVMHWGASPSSSSRPPLRK